MRHLLGGPQLAVQHGRHSAMQRRDDASRERAAEVGRVDALAAKPLRAEVGARARVVEGDVRGAADRERPSRLRPVTAWRRGSCHGSWMRGAGLQHHAPQGNKNVATILAPATPTLST